MARRRRSSPTSLQDPVDARSTDAERLRDTCRAEALRFHFVHLSNGPAKLSTPPAAALK
jgi:hypothetical protein